MLYGKSLSQQTQKRKKSLNRIWIFRKTPHCRKQMWKIQSLMRIQVMKDTKMLMERLRIASTLIQTGKMQIAKTT